MLASKKILMILKIPAACLMWWNWTGVHTL